ncbi:MAG TPA: phospholipase D-like domain-containing protein [Elainellaceae cyanobacterium]
MRLSQTWLRLRWAILLGFVTGLSACRTGVAQSPRLEPLPQDPLIHAYFNYSQAAAYLNPYRDQERLGDDLEQAIIDAIATAQSSIDVAVQELRLPRVAEALKERHQAGVRVRVVLENNYSRPWSSFTSEEISQLNERDRSKYLDFVMLADGDRNGQLSQDEIDRSDALVILQNAGIQWLDDTADGSKGSDLMHHKFIVVDRRIVVVGSANYTLSGTHGDMLRPDSRGNVNHVLKIDSVEVARLFSTEFNLLWGDGPGGALDSKFGLQKPPRPPQRVALTSTSSITVQFSPTSASLPWNQSVNGLIGETLKRAIRSIDLALFVFSDQNLANMLQNQHQQGLQIRALIDPGFAYRNYSEALDMLGIALKDNRCRYEDDNNPWLNPLLTVGIPQLAEGDVLHHKFGVIDAQTVITGSQNWSEAGNRSNDEDLLVIQNSTVAAHFQREFDRLYTTARTGLSTGLQEKLHHQQTRCPT